ncbi:MAG: hypothetical protein HXY41_03655 [Chloroflexi bacterium]|nr:hypothetical protein [Chloroflexota bacterium]
MESSSERKNRARARHERRKIRQQGLSRPGVSRPDFRHLTPPGGFKLPSIKLPGFKIALYGLAGLLLIGAVIVILGRLTGGETETRAANAIWIGTEWTYDRPDETAINALADRLRENRISTVYAWVSLLQPDGAWSETIRLDAVREFVQVFRQVYPEARLYGWLSIASQGEDGGNRLGSTDIQQQVADFSRRMVDDFDFDGLFLNIVPVLDGDENFLALLRRVRATLGEDVFLSVAVPPDWTPPDDTVPQPPQIAPDTYWQPDYKKRVALLADQMVITAYNSGLSTPDDYAAWVAYQVETFAGVVAEMDAATEIIVGVPAYDAETPEHNPAVENITSAVEGVRQGLLAAGEAAEFVRGLAIYAEWDADETDWTQFRDSWLR